MKRIACLAAAVWLTCFGSLSVGAGEMEALPGIEGEEQIAWWINDDNVIAGTSFGWGSQTPVRWVNGQLDVLDDPLVVPGEAEPCEFVDGAARIVNNHGVVSGGIVALCDSGYVERAAIWQNGLWYSVPMPEGANWSWDALVNDKGEIAVRFSTYGPYRVTRKGPELLDAQGCVVFAINNRGVIGGGCGDVATLWQKNGKRIGLDGGQPDGFNFVRALSHNLAVGSLWYEEEYPVYRAPATPVFWNLEDNMEPVSLGPTGWATGVNEHGLVVGTSGFNSADPNDPPHQAVAWPPCGEVQELGYLGGQSVARSVNNYGFIVGNAETGNGEGVGFIYDFSEVVGSYDDCDENY